MLLCNDSGPMHLAAAMGTPVVGLFTCTSPGLSGPIGEEHALLTAAVPCAGAYRKSCPWAGEQHLRCHRALPVDAVFGAMVRALERAAQRRSTQPREWFFGNAKIDAGPPLERQRMANGVTVP